MRFTEPLIPATLVKRYKRFLADVVLSSGEAITAHVANPGAMIGLAAPEQRHYCIPERTNFIIRKTNTKQPNMLTLAAVIRAIFSHFARAGEGG